MRMRDRVRLFPNGMSGEEERKLRGRLGKKP